MDLSKYLKKKPNYLKEEITDVVSRLRAIDDKTCDEYKQLVTTLENLIKLDLSQKSGKNNVSKDVVLTVVGNLLGIVLVINYEKVHVVTSKAFGMIIKGRV